MGDGNHRGKAAVNVRKQTPAGIVVCDLRMCRIDRQRPFSFTSLASLMGERRAKRPRKQKPAPERMRIHSSIRMTAFAPFELQLRRAVKLH